MNLSEILLKDDKKPVFMSEMGMVKRIPKKNKAEPISSGRNCYYCGCEMIKANGAGSSKLSKMTETIDHKTPKCRGGKGIAGNKVKACLSCNSNKGNLTDGEYRAVLAYRKTLTDN